MLTLPPNTKIDTPMEDLAAQLNRYKSFLKSDPNNLRLLADTADMMLRMGQLEEAQTLLDDALENHPNDAALQYHRASLDISLHKPIEAAERLQSLIDQGVDNPGVRYNLAYANLLSLNIENADAALATHFDGITQAIPEALLLSARIKHHQGNVQGALELTQRFLDAQPDNSNANGIAALLYSDEKDYENAASHAAIALKSNPDNSESLVTLGTIALDSQDATTARKHFRHAINVDKNSGRSWLGIGLAAMLEHELDEAEIALRKAVQLMPTNLGTWNTLAWVQISLNHLDDAHETVKKNIEIDRNFGETHGTLAVVEILQGDYEAAKLSIRRAKGLDKDSFSGQYAEGLLAQIEGNPEAAQTIMQNVMNQPIDDRGRTIQSVMTDMASKRTLH